MTQYDNTGKGVLFKNTRKEKETHADYTGSININGRDHYLNAWINTSKNGMKYLSLLIGKEKAQNESGGGFNPRDDGNDETPF